MTTIYRAEWLLPITAPPVRNGAVAVDDERIVAVGPLDDVRAACPGADLVDFDQAVLMPGFVNAHSHLEYTSFRGMFDDEQFGDWIISLIDVKASLTPDEYLASARLGALEALASGVTTIADTTYTGETLTASAQAGLRGVAYLEVFGIDDKRLDETMADLSERLAAAQAAGRPAPRDRHSAARALHRVEPPLPDPCRLRPRAPHEGRQPRRREQRRGHLHTLGLGQVRPRLPREDGLGAHAHPALRREPHQVPAAVRRVRRELPGGALRARQPRRHPHPQGQAGGRRPLPQEQRQDGLRHRAAARPAAPGRARRASAPTARRPATSWTCSTRCAPPCSCTAASSATCAC